MYVGFNKLKGQLAHRPGVTNPGGLAAHIGNLKYGKKAMASGKKLKGHKKLSAKARKNIAGFRG